MSVNPTSFRLPVNIQGKADPDVVEMIGYHDDAIQDLQQAIPSLKTQITALQTKAASTTTTTTTTPSTTGSPGASSTPTGTIGEVNNQSTTTSYATQQSDYGGLVILNDASPIAVTLSTQPAVQTPYFTTIANIGAGTATLTPQSGTITGPSTLAQNTGAIAYYDGTNWWVLPTSTPNSPPVGSGVSQIIAGTNVTISPAGGTGAVTINASGGGTSYLKGSVTLSWSAGDATAQANITVTGAAMGQATFMGTVGAGGTVFPIEQSWCNACVVGANTVDCCIIFPTGGAPSSGGPTTFPIVVYP